MNRTQVYLVAAVVALALLVAFLIGRTSDGGGTTVNVRDGSKTSVDCDRPLDSNASVGAVARRAANC